MPDALSGVMGNRVFIGCFDTLKEMNTFVRDSFSPSPYVPETES